MPRHGDANQPLLQKLPSDATVVVPPSVLDQRREVAQLDENREVASAPPASQLRKPSGGDYVSFVAKTLTGQTFPVIARRTDTITSIKSQVHHHSSIPPSQQRILLNGVDLPDERVVADCGISDGETVSLVMKMEAPPEPLDSALVTAMEKHGLTEAEQRQLHGEGVVDVETFAAVRDEDFALSGIDINARRQEKLQRDRAAAEARHAAAVAQRDERVRRERAAATAAYERAAYEQTQGLLDAAGLSPQGREVVRALRELEELRRLDLAGMAELGLNLVDRQKLEAFCTGQRVQQSTAPVLQQVDVEELTMEEVMTEPERLRREAHAEQQRRQRQEAEETRRQQEEEQRREWERREQERQAEENARKRAECLETIQCLLCCPKTTGEGFGEAFNKHGCDEAARANGMSPFIALWSGVGRFLLWHVAQPAGYFAVYSCAVSAGELDGLQVWLGGFVAGREALYLLTVLACVCYNPALLLVDLRASRHKASVHGPPYCFLLWMYMLSPEVFVLVATLDRKSVV